VLDEAGVRQRSQFGRVVEASPDELAARLAHEGLHLRMPGGVVLALDEDQPLFPGGVVKPGIRGV